MTFYKYCRRCGKRLKGDENRIRGYGKTCFTKIQSEIQKDMPLLIPPSNYPIEIESISFENLPSTSTRGSEQGGNLQGKASSKSQISSKRKTIKGAKPPHLEKTLTPASKKPLLFNATPSTPPTI